MKAETWVQVYRAPIEPGPDGKPKQINQWTSRRVWNAERMTRRENGRIVQEWKRQR